MLSEAWHMEEALEALARAEALAPQPGAGPMRASIASRQGEADTALQLFLAQVEAGDTALASGAAMSALYADSIDAAEVAALHRRLFARLGEGARAVASFRNGREPGRPIRLGMVTPDLHHQHPVNIFMQPVLARWDGEAMPISLYFTGTSHDDETRQARGRVAHWVECASWTDGQLARRIEADGIDILIDLSGHTQRGKMPVFGQRAAPVQVTFLGYPGSTGVPNMDWIIADPVVAPEGSEGLFSERVMRLPQTVFCFAPAPDSYYPDFGPGHAARKLTFGSFNNLPKLTPRTLGLWAEILHRLPESRLLVKAPSFRDPGAMAGFTRRMAALGIAADRLELRGPTGMVEMMAEYADIDIALDPVPYNGGTTTLQAMWMGAPVVARRGEGFVSRMGASFMAAAGLGDWVADSDAAYVEVAVRQGADRAGLLALKRGMRARLLAAPAWDIDRYTRDLQAALRRIWQEFCASAGG
jgi:predicted O-linked N-acetylglucosamine transferase (SPINDLY family)